MSAEVIPQNKNLKVDRYSWSMESRERWRKDKEKNKSNHIHARVALQLPKKKDTTERVKLQGESQIGILG